MTSTAFGKDFGKPNNLSDPTSPSTRESVITKPDASTPRRPEGGPPRRGGSGSHLVLAEE
ncbi:hypothetical protein [Streptomyces sp. NPDC051286]|uniref:hypothetical protein n=1 Tax=Streptomyces sp. NPDC051286 TaxID=3365647 RepID=UPI0037BB219E